MDFDPAKPAPAAGNTEEARHPTPDHIGSGGRTGPLTLPQLAEVLPYLLGFFPDDSVVLLRTAPGDGGIAGALRADLPPEEAEPRSFASAFAESVSPEEADAEALTGRLPDAGSAVLLLCRDPGKDERPRAVRRRLSPLAEALRRACEARGVPVAEVGGVSAGRCWSFLCSRADCCPPDGNHVAPKGSSTSPIAAAAVYEGFPVPERRSLLELRFAPLAAPAHEAQEAALHKAEAEVSTAAADRSASEKDRVESVGLGLRLLHRFVASPPRALADEQADAHDDVLLAPHEAARLIVGLQNEGMRRCAADWVGGSITLGAGRLWRALARRCVGPYARLAVPLLALAGWTSWLSGDLTGSRIASSLALRRDPGYPFAILVHQVCNRGLDPAPFLRSWPQPPHGDGTGEEAAI
ncbi:DUF4192 domain-containing protein [Streptomyces sulphureus]|uniref:DUF4192 domain-containing protein n=1 Tax=Streptomyces sulphureus TaxID=47758 RepID=UPI000478163E|nr:DUF4192 domain-containing protein [Streptomyces sulphureus]